MVAKLVSDDFHPTENEMDARIFYEITGERLPGFEDKLRDQDSSGSESTDPPESPTSVDAAFTINGQGPGQEGSDKDSRSDDSQENV